MLALSGLQPAKTMSQLFETVKSICDIKRNAEMKFNSIQAIQYNAEQNKIHVSTNKLIATLLSCFTEINEVINYVINEMKDDAISEMKDDLVHLLDRHLNPEIPYNEMKDDYMPSLNLARLFAFILRVVRMVQKPCSRATYHYRLKVILMLAFHEVFDSFLRGFNEIISNIQDDFDLDADEIEFVDDDSIPYHRLKTPKMPRGVRVNDLIRTFLYDEAEKTDFCHQILDIQSDDLVYSFEDTTTQAAVNTINSMNFWVRFLPTVNLKMIFEEVYNIQAANQTRSSILKRYYQTQ